MMGFIILPLLCLLSFIVPILWMSYSQSLQERNAVEAINVYPESELIQTKEIGDDSSHSVQSYFYVTDDSLEEVLSYYVDNAQENVRFEGTGIDNLQTVNNLDYILTRSAVNIALAHQDICGRKLYAECISTLLIDLDDDAGETMIIISYWITFP